MRVLGKPHEAASKDASRPVLCGVNYRKDAEGKGWLEATDSYCLVRIPVTNDENDSDAIIPAAAVKAAAANRRDPWMMSDGAVKVTLKDGATDYYKPLDGTFPDCERLMPTNPVSFEFGIDAAILMKLAKALGSDTLRLSFIESPDGGPNAMRPIRVKATTGDCTDAQALIMPVRLTTTT